MLNHPLFQLKAQMPVVPDTVPVGMEHAEGTIEDEALPAVPSHNPLGKLVWSNLSHDTQSAASHVNTKFAHVTCFHRIASN
jgi:hypothetical protein